MDPEDEGGTHVDLDALLQRALTATPESERRIVANALAADASVPESRGMLAGDAALDAEVDGILQQVLAATPETEERIVAGALAADRLAPRPLRMRLASRPVMAGAAALLLALLVAGGFLLRSETPAPRHAASSGPAQKSIVTTDAGVTVIQRPGEPLTLIGPGPGPLNVPVGTASIVLLGELR